MERCNFRERVGGRRMQKNGVSARSFLFFSFSCKSFFLYFLSSREIPEKRALFSFFLSYPLALFFSPSSSFILYQLLFFFCYEFSLCILWKCQAKMGYPCAEEKNWPVFFFLRFLFSFLFSMYFCIQESMMCFHFPISWFFPVLCSLDVALRE